MRRLGIFPPIWKAALSLLLALVLALPAAAEPETVREVRESVVRLYGIGTDRSTGGRIRWAGTGFAVGTAGEETDVFLTNWHVAAGSGLCDADTISLWLLKDGATLDADWIPTEGSAIPCRVLTTTDGYPDVAVIQAEGSAYPALPLMSSSRVINGSAVYALGFPGLDNLDRSGAEDVTVTAGAVSRHLTMSSAENTQSIIHSAALEHGFSGGPLVNGEGVVVALNTYGFESDVSSELFCAVYTDYAMELLDGLGLSYTRVSGPGAVPVLMANVLRQPDLPPAAAYALFFAGLLGLALLMLYIIQSAARALRLFQARRAEKRLKETEKL